MNNNIRGVLHIYQEIYITYVFKYCYKCGILLHCDRTCNDCSETYYRYSYIVI